jgi:hypothetical protein
MQNYLARQVQRREGDPFAQRLDQLRSDSFRTGVVKAAVDHPVADGVRGREPEPFGCCVQAA